MAPFESPQHQSHAFADQMFTREGRSNTESAAHDSATVRATSSKIVMTAVSYSVLRSADISSASTAMTRRALAAAQGSRTMWFCRQGREPDRMQRSGLSVCEFLENLAHK